MEDAHICEPDINGEGIGLFAVFDGHGGIEVAKFCERHFVEQLLKNSNFLQKRYGPALEETFLLMDTLIL